MNIKVFIKDIGVPEFKAVIGKNGNRLLFLTLIFFISLLVLGVGNSSKDLLKTKMQSPFIKFIDVKVPSLHDVKYSKMDTTNARILINENKSILASNFSRGVKKRFACKLNGLTQEPNGMLITTNDSFYKFLTNNETNNSLLTDDAFSDDGFGLILTKSFFEDFDVKGDSAWKKYSFVEIETNGGFVKLPIAAVVEELRNNCKFAFSKNFLNCNYNFPKVFQEDNYNGLSTYFLPNLTQLPSDMDTLFRVIDVAQKLSANCYKDGIMIQSYDTNVVAPFRNSIKILDIRKFANHNRDRDKFINDYFTFYLKDVAKSDIFAEKIKEKFGVEIEKSRMKEKDNINFFEKITDLLSKALMAFAFFSIILFIINVLISHLNSNKRSLGTLKAFGLSNNLILSLYSGITLFLVVVSFSIAYVSTQLIGQKTLNKFLNSSGFENAMYNNLDLSILLLWMVLVPTIFILLRVFQFLHKKTPGDLIYERN